MSFSRRSVVAALLAAGWTTALARSRGINIGNALEAPREGDWSVTIERSDLDLIARAGFDRVRLPVRWTTDLGPAPEYSISTQLLDRVKQVVGWALANNLTVILNVHHFEEGWRGDKDALEKLNAIWRQISHAFAEFTPEKLVFELLNEPHGMVDAPTWNRWLSSLVPEIRKIDRARPLVISGASHGSGEALSLLKLPPDPSIILSFHYYSPFEFTHQGTPWNPKAAAWLGMQWPRSAEDIAAIHRDFARVRQYADRLGVRQVLLGEFGVYGAADSDSRARWTRAVRDAADCFGFDWAYWELRAGFGAFDSGRRRWREEIYKSLMEGNNVRCTDSAVRN